jgi:chromate transporter
MIFFELFYIFFYIGAFTIGGGYAMIPLIQQEVVSAKSWISVQMLTDFIGISQMTPGPFAVNIATFIGSTAGGFAGALFATLGVSLPSFVIMLIIAKKFGNMGENPYFKRIMQILRPVVIALICSAIYFIIQEGFSPSGGHVFDYRDLIIFIALVVIQLTAKKMHPVALIGISAALGILIFGLIP